MLPEDIVELLVPLLSVHLMCVFSFSGVVWTLVRINHRIIEWFRDLKDYLAQSRCHGQI